ncbi:MAG: RGCVC family protein [Blastococcus sp.]
MPVPTPLPTPTPTRVCDVCPHPSESHDAIGARFCQATLHAALSRGCICRTS